MKARQRAFDFGMKDFIVVSAVSGAGMDELFGRVVTLVRPSQTKTRQSFKVLNFCNCYRL